MPNDHALAPGQVLDLKRICHSQYMTFTIYDIQFHVRIPFGSKAIEI